MVSSSRAPRLQIRPQPTWGCRRGSPGAGVSALDDEGLRLHGEKPLISSVGPAVTVGSLMPGPPSDRSLQRWLSQTVTLSERRPAAGDCRWIVWTGASRRARPPPAAHSGMRGPIAGDHEGESDEPRGVADATGANRRASCRDRRSETEHRRRPDKRPPAPRRPHSTTLGAGHAQNPSPRFLIVYAMARDYPLQVRRKPVCAREMARATSVWSARPAIPCRSGAARTHRSRRLPDGRRRRRPSPTSTWPTRAAA